MRFRFILIPLEKLNNQIVKKSESTAEAAFVIAGGGIGGISTAIALANQGFSSRVFEQAPEFSEVGAGMQLGPNALRGFENLGVFDRIAPLLWLPSEIEFRDAYSAKTIMRIPLGEPFEKRFGAPYALVHRADLLDALLEEANLRPRISLNNSHKIIGYQQDADRVRVQFREQGEIQSTALIGCDGIHSKVRAQLVGDDSVPIPHLMGCRTLLARDQVPERLWSPNVILWAGAGMHFIQYPIRGGNLLNLVAAIHPEKVQFDRTSISGAELGYLTQNACPQLQELIARAEHWKTKALCDREPIKNWWDRRVVLLGDAAHPMVPHLAQGAAMAVEDAVELAKHLAENPRELESAFFHYQNARYLRTGKVQTMARLHGALYQVEGIKAEIRNLTFASQSPTQQYRFFHWLYGYNLPPRSAFAHRHRDYRH